MKYIARTLSGKTIEYADRDRLNQAKRRRKDVIVDAWPAADPPPLRSSDAQAWDAWRTRRGQSGSR